MICTCPWKASGILEDQKFWGMVEHWQRIGFVHQTISSTDWLQRTEFFTVFAWYNFQNVFFCVIWEIPKIRQSATSSSSIIANSQHVQVLAVMQTEKKNTEGKSLSKLHYWVQVGDEPPLLLPYLDEKWRENMACSLCHWKEITWCKSLLVFFYSCCCYSSCISRKHFPFTPAFPMCVEKVWAGGAGRERESRESVPDPFLCISESRAHLAGQIYSW